MTNITKVSNLKPVSFEVPVNRLTPAQTEMLKLLKKCIEEKKILNRDVVLDFYIKHIKKSESYTLTHRWDWIDGGYIRIKIVPELHLWKEEYMIGYHAKTWFQRNLGAVIMKGKLLVIPIINLD